MKHHERIRQHIKSRGIRFNFVAKSSGIPLKKFYRLMSGETDMVLHEYEAICKKGLFVEPSYFFTENVSENENMPSAQ